MERYVCVHGHFYQPPRENPWLDAIEVEDSAYPYHDWNERITAECYGPNAASRILDGDGFIERIVNNYARISFNFGPTLLSWLERNAADAYAAILEADRESRSRYSGHGSALAQAHNHMIMPLANARDKRTQVVWGIRDFEHRFGRRPEGMWLPETAVDTPTLEALAEQGIAFTVLAPRQARRVRALDGGEWQDVDESTLDPTQAYVARLPSGRGISLFFYDGPLSQAVAFERVLQAGEEFARRLVEAAGDDDRPRLAHISTDGETYGHHQRFGDMALAYALDLIESENAAHLTNYGEFLERYPPSQEVEIVEESSWSCAHGVERWRSDCGCSMGSHPGWRQAWRAPLRQALDWLCDRLASRFENEGGALLRDPWAARDAYVELVLERTPERSETFVRSRALRPLGPAELTNALKLLEMQRQAMLMYASCAWFYDDVSGIETVQALMHAARAIQLAEEPYGDGIEAGFLERLAAAKSNLREQGDGAAVYRRYVEPVKVDLRRLAGHYAVSSIFQDFDDEAEAGTYVVRRSRFRRLEAGRSALALGRGWATSAVTLESAPFHYAVLHQGDQNLSGGLTVADDEYAFQRLSEEATAVFVQGDFASMVRFLADRFEGEPLSLRSLFRDEQRRIIRLILDPALADAEEAYRHLYQEHMPMIRFLASIHFPLPHRLSLASEIALDLELGRTLADDSMDAARVRSLLEEAQLAGVALDGARLALVMQSTLGRLATAFAASPGDEDVLGRFEAAAGLLPSLPFEVDLWRAQNLFYQTVQRLLAENGVPAELRQRLTSLGESLRVRVR